MNKEGIGNDKAHIPQTYVEYDQASHYNPVYDSLGRPSAGIYSSENQHASTAFQTLARLRTVALSKILQESPKLKLLPFLMLDRLSALSSPLTDEEHTAENDVFKFSTLNTPFSGNEFYDQARNDGVVHFRTCLGTYPVVSDSLGVKAGRIGQLLDTMLSPTPLDFATAGAFDRCAGDSTSSDLVAMTTEYVDPDLDLIYDIEGNTWEFDAELHAVASRYTYLREIWNISHSRSGMASKAHLLLFAALRLAALLNALEPLSISGGDVDPSIFNVRGYLLAVANAALPLIRMFALLRRLIPPGGSKTAFSAVPHIGDSNMVVWVLTRDHVDRVMLVTDGENLKHLLIKAIIEGSTQLDTSLEPKAANGKRFSEFANNEVNIRIFLSNLHRIDDPSSSPNAKQIQALTALSLNTPQSAVRPSLLGRNNGLKSGIDLMLQDSSTERIAGLIGQLRGVELERVVEDVKAIEAMDEFGVTDDHAVQHLGKSALEVSAGELYELQYPIKSSCTLRRRRKVVGKLVVVDGKFTFKKGGVGAIGLLTVFETVRGVGVMGNGVAVDFRAPRHDPAAVANACLSNVFGWEAAVFVLEHILLGGIAVLEGRTPSYLIQAKTSPDGVGITSFLHPVVTEKLAFYKATDGDSFFFDTKTILGRQKLEIDGNVGTLSPVVEETVTYRPVAQSIGRKYLA